MVMINPLQQKLLHAEPVLNFKQLNLYLDFSAQFMKNISFYRKVQEYETNGILWKLKQIMQHALKMQ